MSAKPNPGDLRLSWVPFRDPIHHWECDVNGNPFVSTLRGHLRVEWDSPTGLFVYLNVMQREPVDYERLRPTAALLIAEAYPQRDTTWERRAHTAEEQLHHARHPGQPAATRPLSPEVLL